MGQSEKIVVHNPEGYPPAVVGKSLAPRLGTLNGKTAYLVDCRFEGSDVFLMQVQAWFAQHMPGLNTVLVHKNHSNYVDDPATWAEIKGKGHAAILAVGHCSGCSPAATAFAINLETKYRVPTVVFHTDRFYAVSQAVARANGTPRLRQIYVPMPVQGKTAQEMRAYVDGADAVTGVPVMTEVLQGLTAPLADEDINGLSYTRTTPRLCEPDTEENLHRIFLDNNWTDKLPIVLPTEARVADMLNHTSHAPDEVVGHMAPTYEREVWEYTVEKVAVNAVMAGASPEYLPVILALASSGLTSRSSSSASRTNMVVVNGPIRRELNMNCEIGALGPYNHANSTIGRAYGMLSANLQGGSVPNLTYMGSQGNGYGYGLTFGENEEDSPWEPFHVQHGFDASESVVSIFESCVSTSFVMGVREKHWRDHVRHMLIGNDPDFPPTVLLDPVAARQFIEIAGLQTKQDIRDWMYDNALMRASEYWDYQHCSISKYPRAIAGEEPWASRLKAGPDDMIRIFDRDEIQVVVVGGNANAYWRMIGGGYSGSFSADAWR